MLIVLILWKFAVIYLVRHKAHTGVALTIDCFISPMTQ